MAQKVCCLGRVLQSLFFLRQSPNWDNSADMSPSNCSDDVYMQNVACVHTLLNAVVGEIWWDERLSPDNHNAHFPHFPYL